MDENAIIVRAAVPGDELAVARVHVRSWQMGYRGLLADAYLDELRAEDRAARYTFGSADEAAPTTIVAERDGIIGAFATYGAAEEAEGPNAGAVHALYVDPAAWRLGFGKRLIRMARVQLAERGYSEAVLWLLAGNRRARLFYEDDGWACDDRERTIEIWGITVRETRFRRMLP